MPSVVWPCGSPAWRHGMWLHGRQKPSSCDLYTGNYTLSSVLPSAPDMAQFKQGVRSVAGKLSVFANGVVTSIQVSAHRACGPGRGSGVACDWLMRWLRFSNQDARTRDYSS